MTRRVSSNVPRTPADEQVTAQVSDQEPQGNRPASTGGNQGRRRARRRALGDSAWPVAVQDPLEEWAAAVAAAMPPLRASQVAAVARIAARLDASHRYELSADEDCE